MDLKWVYHTDLNINIKSTVVLQCTIHTRTHTQRQTSHSLWNIEGVIYKEAAYFVITFSSSLLLYFDDAFSLTIWIHSSRYCDTVKGFVGIIFFIFLFFIMIADIKYGWLLLLLIFIKYLGWRQNICTVATANWTATIIIHVMRLIVVLQKSVNLSQQQTSRTFLFHEFESVS